MAKQRGRQRKRTEDDPLERGDELLEQAEQLIAGEGAVTGVRCPYCRAVLTDGALAGACAACDTLHHLGCFAEHGGCSTHGCGSTRAHSLKVGAPRPLDFPPLGCVQCKQTLESHELVARCACGRTLHPACYEALAHCGREPRCLRPVELMSHLEAAAQRMRTSARGYTALGLAWIGAVLAVLVIGAAAEGAPPLAVALALGGVSLGGWCLLVLALRQRLEARRLERQPRAPRPQPEPPAKGG